MCPRTDNALRVDQEKYVPASVYCTFTALLRNPLIISGAGEGNRTLVSGLGSPHSTIEPHPQRVSTIFTARVTRMQATKRLLVAGRRRIRIVLILILASTIPQKWVGQPNFRVYLARISSVNRESHLFL